MSNADEALRRIGLATELRLRPMLRLLLDVDATVSNSTYTFTVPAAVRWRIRSGYLRLQTSGTVGNRRVILQATRAGARFLYVAATDVQAASKTCDYTFAQMQGDLNFVSDYLLISIPEIVLQADDSFSLLGLLSTDAVLSLAFLVEQW